MHNSEFIDNKILKKIDQNIIWSNNKFFKGDSLLEKIKVYSNKIRKKKINKGSLIAFEDEFNFKSIAFFLAAIKENLIIIPLPKGQRHLLNLVPCSFFFNIDNENIHKIKKKKISIKILNKFQMKKRSGLIVFSSGSSGKPKAILHDFKSLLNKFKIERPGFKTILMLTFDHLGGINTLLASLFFKDGVAICTTKRDPVSIGKLIQKTKAELLPTTPTFLNIFLLSREYKKRNLASIKLITFGAEFMPSELLKKLKQTFKKVKFKQTYGLSEIGVMRTKSKDNDSLSIKVGGEDYKIKIINEILYIKSKSNMVGYLNAPQPFDKDGWMNTKDRVIDKGDGYLRIIGRQSEIINVGGEKVYPQEIENTLLKCDGIADSRVYKNRHDILGEYVVAEVVFNRNLNKKRKNKDYLRKFCESKLPKYKVPSKFIIKKMQDILSDRLKKLRKNI